MTTTRKRRLAAGIMSVVAMATASLFALSTPAEAQAVCIEPEPAALYLYANRNGSGDVFQATVSVIDFRVFGFNDKASRVWNKYDCRAWVLYDDNQFEDRHYCIRPNQTVDLHLEKWNFGDKISSVKKLTGKSCSGYPTFG
ncbi:peptidase inhibitor family I36 protein [Actinoplanes sp. NPDC048988]|uniref:peptidase inhibitor family I36 protein n=1 Tax=Actinoplanes sp. NPDC048988 TaxID=3363901 RepID=UPI003712C27F